MKVFRVQTGLVMYSSRFIIVALLVTNLAACGFHLRGSSSLPPRLASMQVLAENLDSSQKALLNQQLIQAGASLKDNQAIAKLVKNSNDCFTRPDCIGQLAIGQNLDRNRKTHNIPCLIIF